MKGASFPSNYLALRRKFHRAVHAAEWNAVKSIIEDGYELEKPEWFNVPALGIRGKRHTILHRMAGVGHPMAKSRNPLVLYEHDPGWDYLIEKLMRKRDEIWSMIHSHDNFQSLTTCVRMAEDCRYVRDCRRHSAEQCAP